MHSFILSHARASGSCSSCLKQVILDLSCIVFAGGTNLVINKEVHSTHDAIVFIGKDSNHSFSLPLRVKENKRNLIVSGSTSLMRIISHILVKVFNCMPTSSTAEPPN